MRTALTAVLLIGWTTIVPADDTPKLSPDLHPSVWLEADGKPIDHGAAWGHAGPCVFDVDGRRGRVVVNKLPDTALSISLEMTAARLTC